MDYLQDGKTTNAKFIVQTRQNNLFGDVLGEARAIKNLNVRIKQLQEDLRDRQNNW